MSQSNLPHIAVEVFILVLPTIEVRFQRSLTRDGIRNRIFLHRVLFLILCDFYRAKDTYEDLYMFIFNYMCIFLEM